MLEAKCTLKEGNKTDQIELCKILMKLTKKIIDSMKNS